MIKNDKTLTASPKQGFWFTWKEYINIIYGINTNVNKSLNNTLLKSVVTNNWRVKRKVSKVEQIMDDILTEYGSFPNDGDEEIIKNIIFL